MSREVSEATSIEWELMLYDWYLPMYHTEVLVPVPVFRFTTGEA
jgi:hypothetical protein